jgi:hypothetical protein
LPSLSGSIPCGSDCTTSKFSGRPSLPQSRCGGGGGDAIQSSGYVRDYMGSSVVGNGGGSSTLISMLSDTVRPVESMTVRSTL